MNTCTILTLLLIGFAASPANATGAKYVSASTHAYSNSHNNYHGANDLYGPSKHNYNGTQDYTGAPKYQNHPADYTTSRQSTDTSAPY